jgi:multimeric flavodoxin WrbA
MIGWVRMKITVITSSPRKHGTSALLADEFIRGAEDAGHNVFRFNAAFEKLSPCLGCDHCRRNNAVCVQSDSMEKLNPHLLDADVVVFVTPLYYYAMSAQLKTVIDRFYANNERLVGSGKKSILMATSYDDYDWTMKALTTHYQTILRYMDWNDAGILFATGCGSREDIERTQFPELAYQMGKRL